MKRTIVVLLMLLVATLSVACSGGETEEPAVQGEPAPAPTDAPLPEQVQKAVGIAAELAAQPDEADEVLAKHGMTREGFESLMYEIAASSELSQAYNKARSE
jgi:hypothetical protein